MLQTWPGAGGWGDWARGTPGLGLGLGPLQRAGVTLAWPAQRKRGLQGQQGQKGRPAGELNSPVAEMGGAGPLAFLRCQAGHPGMEMTTRPDLWSWQPRSLGRNGGGKERAVAVGFLAPAVSDLALPSLSPQACQRGHSQHLEHLLFYGAEPGAQNASGNTALHICALYNKV